MPLQKKPRQHHNNETKKLHLMNMLQYTIMNQETLNQGEDQRRLLRKVAHTLHCTTVGVRLRYDNRGNDEMIEAFNSRDLLTAKQRAQGDDMYSKHVTKVESFARGATIPEEGVLPAELDVKPKLASETSIDALEVASTAAPSSSSVIASSAATPATMDLDSRSDDRHRSNSNSFQFKLMPV